MKIVKYMLCIEGGHSHHQFDVNLVGFHTIIFLSENNTQRMEWIRCSKQLFTTEDMNISSNWQRLGTVLLGPIHLWT